MLIGCADESVLGLMKKNLFYDLNLLVLINILNECTQMCHAYMF